MDRAGSTPGCISAVVRAVHVEQKYVVAYPDKGELLEGEPITFSLSAWTNDDSPRRNQCVRLSQVTLFEKGWRAMRAAPVTTGEG